MTFANPSFLWALLLVPVAGILLWWAGRSQRAALQRLGEYELIRRLAASVNWSGRRWKNLVWLLAMSLLIIALSRPQWGQQTRIVEQEGVQVMVVLDVSKSMLAQDLKPDRLTRAKMEISDLMNRLNGDEIGLVLFSGASFIQFPLTSDYDTARHFLESAGPDVISRPGTALGEAIHTALNGFDPQRNNQRVVLIVTDGESHDDNPLLAAQAAAEQGAVIYTIGMGSVEGEPIPEFDSADQLIGYKKDRSGQVILSKLDENTLVQIARRAGGQYFRASADGSELDALAAELDALQAARLDSREETTKIERYQIALAAGLAALVGAEFIPERRRNPAAASRKNR